MRKEFYLFKVLIVLFSLFCLSCEKETDLGFPQRITFTSEGGVKDITGSQPFTHAEILDYNGNHGSIGSGEDGKTYNVYDWLTVEYVGLYNEVLKVYATPNTTGSRRTLYIEVYSGQEYDVIKVMQE